MLVLALDLSWRPVRLRGWLWRLADCLALAVRAGAAAPRPEAASLARFEALVLPHLDAAYNLARYLTGSADAAGDAVQEAMLRAFRGFAGYRGGEPRAWLLAIVRNCCRAWAGARRGQPGPLPDDEDAPLPEDPGQFARDGIAPPARGRGGARRHRRAAAGLSRGAGAARA